jgi:nicotinamidase-related amidase
MLLRADTSLLFVIDIQDRLLPAMADPGMVEVGASRLMRAARHMGVPLLVSEQYPKGIGRTVPALAALATPEETVEKIHFSCAAEPAVQAQLSLMGPRRQAVLCGIEAHVCVLQSALGLAADGWSVAVVEDAVSSRRPADRDAALRRLAAAGIVVATIEMVIFEWLGRAGTDVFRDLLKLVK